MKARFKKFSVLLLGVSTIVSRTVWSTEKIPEIRQITTHPSVDFSPAVSPDGQWLAFTSERGGNLDIWVKKLPREQPVRVTTHKAEDLQPVWSPDGRRLAFVSKRRDAQGDIWLVTLDLKRGGVPKGRPVQMTHYLGLDRRPSFSPTGREIVFASDRDGLLNLWAVDVASGETHKLTFLGGTDPAWSPVGNWVLFTSFRSNPGGDLFLMNPSRPEREGQGERVVYPVTWGEVLDGQAGWSPDGDEIVFLRFDRDTNGDGEVTPEDNGCLWQKKLVEEGRISPERISLGRDEIQITTEVYQSGEPCWGSSGEILFTSLRRGGMDVWSISRGGIFGRTPSAAEQYALVLDRFGEVVSEEALFQSILGYQRVRDYFPLDSAWVARSLLQAGEIFQVLSRADRARRIWEAVERDYASQRREVALAELKMATLTEEPIEIRIEHGRRVIESLREDPGVAAEAWIVLGDLYRERGDKGQSLMAYTRILRSFPKLRHMRAQAQLKIGDLLNEDGQEEMARQSYLSALREFGDVPLWRKRAGERLLGLVKGSPQERIRGYQQIVQEVQDLPSLVAEAQIAIGKVLLDQGQDEQAIRELERIERMVPTLLWAHAEAKIHQARAYTNLGDELKGILLLEDVIDSYGSVEAGRFGALAEEELFVLLFESAERLKALGDFALAEARYRKAMALRSGDVRVHRGYIEAVYRRGKIDALIQEYERKIQDRPRDPVLLYGLGLALSYKGERNPDVLERSNAFLERALAEDYRMIHPYRTLSFNYEVLEKLAEEKERRTSGFFVRAGRTLIAPMKWLFGWLPSGRRKKEVGYYERAIQALTTALELNDETLNPRMEALLAQNLGNNFYHLGEFGYKKAYQYYRMRLSLDSTFVQPLEKAVFYERAGHCGVVLEETESAAEYLITAITIYRDLNREEDVLRNLRMLAFLYHLAGRYEDAIAVYEETVVRDERAGWWDEAERDYRNIAYNYHLMGEPEDVLKYAKKAENILQRKKIPMSPPEKSSLRIGILGFSIPVWSMEEIGGALSEGFSLAEEAALVYGLMSRSFEAMKSYREAIVYETKRLEIFQKRKDRLAERVSLNRIGMLYYKMSDYERAWDYFYRSWEANKKRRDLRGRWVNVVNLGNVATVELSLLGEARHTEEAIRRLRKELEWIFSDDTSATRRERLALMTTLGTLWALLAREEGGVDEDLEGGVKGEIARLELLRKAESMFQRSVKLARREGLWREEGILMKNLAEVAEMAGDDSTAYVRFQESYRILRRGGVEGFLWRILYSMANLLRRRPALSRFSLEKGMTPLEYYTQAMVRLESLPVQEEGSEERLSDREERWSLYVDAALGMVRQGMVKQALETVERGREKQVADLLARRPPRLKRERHKIAWGNVLYVRSRLQEIRKEIMEEEVGQSGDSRGDEWREKKAEYEKEYAQLMGKMREEDEVLAYLSGAEPVDLERVQSLLPRDGGVVSYLLGSDRPLVWTVDRDTVCVSVLPVETAVLEKKVEEFLQGVEADSSTEMLSQELYDMLLRPVASFLEEKASILVVPDGFLWNVPFGALSDEGEILLDRITLTYAPSLAAYRLAWGRRKVNQDDGVLVGDVKDGAFLTSMERATKRRRALLGSEATERAFRKVVVSADVVQVERWALYNEKDPLTSSVVLFPGDGEDGYLQVQEMFSWDVVASLFLLPPRGEGVETGWKGPQAFFYGLLYAGVPSVVTSLWPVDGGVKEVFFGAFYRRLNDLSVSEALAEAQLFVRGRYPELRAWGGFRVVGFGGMDLREKVRFAENHLMATVRKGRAFEQQGEYGDAVETYEGALDMAEAMGDSSTIPRITNEILRAAVSGGIWKKAIVSQNRLRDDSERKGEREGVLWSVKNLVEFYRRDGQFDEAARMKVEYIRLLQGEGREEELVSSYEDMAFILASNREYDEAVRWIEKAYRLNEEREDRLGQGRALIMKGRFELDADSYWEARRDLSRGVVLIEKALEVSPATEKANMELASGYQLLGVALEKLTQYEEALEFQKKGLALFGELNRPVQVAQGHQYLANVYWKMGDYRRGLDFQKKALNAFEALGDKKLLAMAYSTQGLIHMSLGELSKAKSAEQKALGLAEEIRSLADQATILKNVGLIAILEEDYTRAYGTFLQASRIDSSLGFRRGLAYDYRNMGILLIHMERSGEGIPFLKSGLRLSMEVGDKRNAIQCFYGLGQAHGRLGDRGAALALLDSGLVEVSQLVVPELLWRLYRQRAGVLAGMGRKEEALVDFQKAVEVVEGLRAELKVEAFKQGFLDDKMDLYVDVVRHLLGMGREEEAFDFVERAKSRNFIDLLGNQKLVLTKGQDELLDRERSARSAIREAQDRLARIPRGKGTVSQRMEEERRLWEEELERRRRAYQQVLVAIQAENPELASFVNVDPWRVEKIQAILPDSTALVEYFLTKKELFCWVVLGDKIVSKRVDVQEEAFQEMVKRFRQAIQAYLSSEAESRALYRWLVQPVEKELRSVRHVVFAPHGVLHYLPFAALQDDEGRYLVERFSLSLTPSATVLGYCMEKGEKVSGGRGEKGVLALSNPDLGSPVYDLPFAEKEVTSLERAYGNVTAFFGREATEKAVRNRAGAHGVIHFACHGTYESETPLFSALLMSPEGADDGRLEAHEIFSLNLKCDLVTLSACETGLAKITRGDEIIGLARSFIFAGTPSIITSLWKVDDLATAVMVKRFYRYLRAGHSRAEALRRAQLLVKEAVNGHPAAWAAFGLTGDFR